MITHRPDPLFKMAPPIKVVPFEIKSLLHIAKEQGRDNAQALEDAGHLDWHIQGTILSQMGVIEGHQIQSVRDHLIERYVIEKTDLFGLDVEKISESLCQSVAVVSVAIKSIEGGLVYSPDELIALAFNIPDLWLALLAKAGECQQGKLMSLINQE